jgi:hypothetical protein
MTERKYQLVKIRAGDYLLLSNDAKTLWRIYRYEDGRSYGLKDMKGDVQLWAYARWDGTPASALQADDLQYAWDRWVNGEHWLKTRQEAIDKALTQQRGAP